MMYAQVKHEYQVINVKLKEEMKVISDCLETAVVCAIVLNQWKLEDCIATEIEELNEDGECCILTPLGI